MKVGFDYRQYLKTQKIIGIANIKQEDITIVEQNQANWISTAIFQLRNSILQKIDTILPQKTKGVCTALLLGDKTFLEKEIQNSFKQSSLSHMLAISGAHISYLLLAITTFLEKLKLHKRWSKIVSIVFLLFFMALVDFTPSVTRAGIMSILVLLANILFLKSNVYQNLAISSFIILVINPYTLFDIGFQLSFGGTIGIILFQTKNREKAQKWYTKLMQNCKQIVRVSIYANLIIFPIMLYHFNTVSVTFLLSNLLASPILGVSLIMGMIFIILVIICKPIAQLFSHILNPILQLFIQIANISSKLPLSQILLPTPKLWQILLYYILLFFIYSKRKGRQFLLKLYSKLKMQKANFYNFNFTYYFTIFFRSITNRLCYYSFY